MSGNSEGRRPNIFQYATKELSQDAMICWLLDWARSDRRVVDEALSDCGRALVKALMAKHNFSLAEEIKQVIIKQQDRGIDVLARVNDRHVFLIEDKTYTSYHSGQLQRYYEQVTNGVARDDIYPIYLKTGNYQIAEGRKINEIELEGTSRRYEFFDRRDLLDILDSYQGKDPILLDYRDHLQGLEDCTESYNSWHKGHRSQWSWLSWEGFFRRLEEQLADDPKESSVWGYVPNQSGGFLGFWWKDYKLYRNRNWCAYLQLQVTPGSAKPKKELCFKIASGDAEREYQYGLKRQSHEKILQAGGERVRKPDRMRYGKTMTVAVWEKEWLAFDTDGKLDLTGTVKNLKEAECVLAKAFDPPGETSAGPCKKSCVLSRFSSFKSPAQIDPRTGSRAAPWQHGVRAADITLPFQLFSEANACVAEDICLYNAFITLHDSRPGVALRTRTIFTLNYVVRAIFGQSR